MVKAKVSTVQSGAATRAEFLRTARRLFAERGFYGVSIAHIAEELGLTKQALLHHFNTKEQLYGEVLSQMADGLAGIVSGAQVAESNPKRRLEEMLLKLHESMQRHPENTQLLMRALLDNRVRAEHAHNWHLKSFLDSVTAMVRDASRGELTMQEALARAYLVLGALNYLVISEPTLKRMYPALGNIEARFAPQIRRLVHAFLG